MTVPPLPASPCLRVKLDWTNTDSFLAGNRFYLSYAGAAPTPGNCTTLAGDVAAAVSAHLLSGIHEGWALTEVDVLDIASYDGFSGQWTGSESGAGSGVPLTANTAFNVEYDIARRYRGGKPRLFLPPPDESALQDAGHWTDDQVAATTASVLAFFTAIEALAIGAIGALAHVNLSYYKGFTNVTNSSGRTRAAPSYRDAALVDAINGYAAKKVVGSQRRRRTATTY